MKRCLLSAAALVLVPLMPWLAAPSRAAEPPSRPKEVVLDLGDQVTMKLVLVPAGRFRMGSPASQQADILQAAAATGLREYDARPWFDTETPQHEVAISQPFYMGVCPVTQQQYEQVMAANPSSVKGPQGPVEMVSWDDAVEFCRKLSARTGRTLRLPTEAEWEYACRAGTDTPFNTGETIGTDQANFDGTQPYGNGANGEFRGKPLPVGSFKPNAFGLYDMHGNVWQWCGDWYEPDYYARSPKADPTGPAAGTGRILRGGSWRGYPLVCRSAYRGWFEPGVRLNSLGFRVVDLGPAGLAAAQYAAAADDIARREQQAAVPPRQPAPESTVDMNALAQIGGFPKEIGIFANRGGFCLDLGCGDGTLAAQIARRTKYSVFALAKDDADCAKARRALDQTGLYGTRAAAVAGSLRELPFPDGYGNLIVTGDYQDALDLKEVLRVLNPNGMAVIGGGAADAAKLKAALDAAGVTQYQLHGNFALLRGRMPEGLDDWTHFGHGPDNIRTSRDATIRPPFRTQWMLAGPAHDNTAVQHPAIARGRVIFRNTRDGQELDRIYCYDAFNGATLWERPVPIGGRNNYRYALVDGVCYWLGYQGVIDAFDPQTGRQVRQYRIPDAGYAWWLAVEDGVLYALGRTADCPPSQVYGMADLFCAFDVKSGRVLWKHQCKLPAQMASAAVGGGGLYYFDIQAEGAGKAMKGTGAAHCLDARTGTERWHSDLGAVCTLYNDLGAAGYIDGKYFVWSCKDAKGVTGTKAFDGKTGQLAKDYPGLRSWGEGWVAPLLFVGGKIYSNPIAGHSPYQCVDMATGEKLQTAIDHGGATDDPGTASASCLYSGGEWAGIYDLVSGTIWHNPWFRVSDFAAPFPAHGMLFYFPAVCHCPHAFAGPQALAPAGLDWMPPEADNDVAARLVRGPAFDTPLAADGAGGWTHYRGNPGHTGETAAAPRTPLAMGWQRPLGGRLTPPSFGGGLAFVGSREGSVWALDEKTGEVRWRFLCGAGVRVTPAFGRGRVLFGSDDGWVYNLDAATGRLAWRFRAAPEPRYIHAEGQINSAWPSAAGVLLDGPVAYCAAGLAPYDGTYLYALDMKTGQPLWARRIGDPQHDDGAPQGIMALAGDTLVVPAFKGRGSRAYRKTDGASIPWYEGSRRFWTFGSEAVADGDVWFYGGARHGNDTDENKRRDAGAKPYTLMDLKTGWVYAAGDRVPAQVARNLVAPVLGRTSIVGDGAAYDRARYCEASMKDPGTVDGARTWSLDFWPDGDRKTSALVLAGGVVLAAGNSQAVAFEWMGLAKEMARPRPAQPEPGAVADDASSVVAFEAKAGGKELSRVTVPGTILRNSLAVSDGKVFVVTEQGGVVCLRSQEP